MGDNGAKDGHARVVEALIGLPGLAVCLTAGTLLALSMIAGTCQAQVFLDSDGFEISGGYSVDFMGDGRLEGQQDWKRTPFTGSAVVQNVIMLDGDQAIRVDRAANSDDRWVRQVTGLPTERFISVEWDMRVEDAEGAANEFGPFFGAEAVQQITDPPAMASVGVFASFGVDATTGEVLFQAEDTGFLTDTGESVMFGEWNHFEIQLDFLLDQYSVYLNDVFLATTGFIDRGQGLDDFTQVGLLAAGAAPDVGSQSLTGTAYYDNLVAGQVPEPNSLLLIVMGILGVRLVLGRTRTGTAMPATITGMTP